MFLLMSSVRYLGEVPNTLTLETKLAGDESPGCGRFNAPLTQQLRRVSAIYRVVDGRVSHHIEALKRRMRG